MSDTKDILVRTFIHDLRHKVISIGADIRLILMGLYGDTNEEINKSLKEAHRNALLVEKIIYEQFRLLDAFDEDENNFLEPSFDVKSEVIYPALKEFACILEQEEGESSCSIGGKNVHIELDLPSDKSLTVKGKKLLLISIFRNIIGNAVEYSGKEEVKVSIAVRVAGSDYEFSISNDGAPIEEEIASKIFKEPSLYGGERGRGLYGVGKIIEMHGGKIYYDNKLSTPCFIFTLPMQPQQEL